MSKKRLSESHFLQVCISKCTKALLLYRSKQFSSKHATHKRRTQYLSSPVVPSQVKNSQRHDSSKCQNNMRFLVLIISLILACVSSAAQEEDISNKACGNCKHKLEYCEPYESTCQPCEAICLPPTNQKFAECGKLCHNFLQDILIGKVQF